MCWRVSRSDVLSCCQLCASHASLLACCAAAHSWCPVLRTHPTLLLCTHPAGSIRVHQFRGEEDGLKVNVVDASAGEAVYILQGAYHVVENTRKGTTRFIQIFDHPFGGAVFAAPALAALPRNIVNSAFSAPILASGTTGKPAAIINVNPCAWW